MPKSGSYYVLFRVKLILIEILNAAVQLPTEQQQHGLNRDNVNDIGDTIAPRLDSRMCWHSSPQPSTDVDGLISTSSVASYSAPVNAMKGIPTTGADQDDDDIHVNETVSEDKPWSSCVSRLSAGCWPLVNFCRSMQNMLNEGHADDQRVSDGRQCWMTSQPFFGTSSY